MRIAINGLGRIGRAALKVAMERSEVEVAAVNDLADVKTLKYLLKYDSVYGRFGRADELGSSIQVLSEKDPAQLPWADLGVDIVIESTGVFTNREAAAKHLTAGAKKVVISANSKDADLSVVMGVNQDKYDPARHDILANCSCTTNCAAPVMKVLNDNFTVKKAHMTTVHAVTSTQNLVDGPSEKLRRGRAAFASIIPTTTGAADAVVRVLPELEGRITGAAFRVPVLCGSVLEVVAHTAKETSPEEVNDIFREAADSRDAPTSPAGRPACRRGRPSGRLYNGIIEVNDEGLVSTDIVGTTASAIVDLPSTKVIKDFVRLVAWYDNEYAYACRLLDLVEYLASRT